MTQAEDFIKTELSNPDYLNYARHQILWERLEADIRNIFLGNLPTAGVGENPHTLNAELVEKECLV